MWHIHDSVCAPQTSTLRTNKKNKINRSIVEYTWILDMILSCAINSVIEWRPVNIYLGTGILVYRIPCRRPTMQFENKLYWLSSNAHSLAYTVYLLKQLGCKKSVIFRLRVQYIYIWSYRVRNHKYVILFAITFLIGEPNGICHTFNIHSYLLHCIVIRGNA